MFGKVYTKEEIEKISKSLRGINNYQFSGYYITPWGKFETSILASRHPLSILDSRTIRKWCKNSNSTIKIKSKIKDNLFPNINYIGKSLKELGFYF